MVYEQGKTYRSATGEVLYVDEVGETEVKMKLLVGANGKIPEDNLMLVGPIETFQDFMTSVGAVEVANVLQ